MRLFTVAEANALLPTLRPLMQSIVESMDRLKERTAVVIREKGLDPDRPDLVECLKQDGEFVRLMDSIRESAERIDALGCLCKGIEKGLVDFPCVLGDETVLLCWAYGEESVSHWHGLEEGFAGRRPLLDPTGGPKTHH